MIATVTVCIIFGAILIALSLAFGKSTLLMCIGIGIAIYPVTCAILFAICSVADLKLMRSALASAVRRSE